MEENRIIVIKREFAPVVMHPEGYGYFIMWDYKPAMEDDGNGNMIEADHGTCCCVHAPYRKPTIGLVKYLINDYYNEKTNRKIFEGFKWEGKTVYLSNENQFNYKALYDIALQTDGASLPAKIKLGSDETPDYVEFKTVESFQQFYFACVAWINGCVNDGWVKKDSVDYSVFETALENVPDLPENIDILTNTL